MSYAPHYRKLKFFIAEKISMSPWEQVQDVTLAGEAVFEDMPEVVQIELGCTKKVLDTYLDASGFEGIDLMVRLIEECFKFGETIASEDFETGFQTTMHRFPLFFTERVFKPQVEVNGVWQEDEKDSYYVLDFDRL